MQTTEAVAPWDEGWFQRVCDSLDIPPEMRDTLRRQIELDRAYREAHQAERERFKEDIQARMDEQVRLLNQKLRLEQELRQPMVMLSPEELRMPLGTPAMLSVEMVSIREDKGEGP
jgi:hypothetical protein